MLVTAGPGAMAHGRVHGPRAVYRDRAGQTPMMSYSFDSSPIYAAGHTAAASAVVALIFGVLAFA
jgi:hypothetical protein